ncbi:hypothetical protein [Zavarzinella formosa]|uniref:hypothetical protein n=1 Tax=Zavarzinella formosa TaxID=360055 RepID=UPI0002E30EAD|nr:hypothetical protein [Zavarzinella formosa]
MNPLFGLIAAVVLLGAPPDMPVSPDPKMLELIRQLGHKSFQVREIAARDLLKKGTEAVPYLTAGAKDANSEVAERCRQLLPVAAAKERNEKLAQLLKEPLGPLPKGLVGLEQFIAITGDGLAPRQLYAEMLDSHHAIIEAMESDPKAGSMLMNKFIDKLYDHWSSHLPPRQPITNKTRTDQLFTERSQMALFLFVRANPRFIDDPENAFTYAMLMNSKKLQQAVSGPEEIPGMKKLFLHWLPKEKDPYVASNGFLLAGSAKMKEASPAVLKAIADKKLEGHFRGRAMMTLVKLGDKNNLKDLEPSLTDHTLIETNLFAGDVPPLKVQLRDMALGVSIILSGQKPGDFGFDKRCKPWEFGNDDRVGIDWPDSCGAYGFQDDAKRETAHAKWKAWVESQDKPVKK